MTWVSRSGAEKTWRHRGKSSVPAYRRATSCSCRNVRPLKRPRQGRKPEHRCVKFDAQAAQPQKISHWPPCFLELSQGMMHMRTMHSSRFSSDRLPINLPRFNQHNVVHHQISLTPGSSGGHNHDSRWPQFKAVTIPWYIGCMQAGEGCRIP